jgi:hypothetical protein
MPIWVPARAMILKIILKILLIVYSVWVVLGLINSGFSPAFASEFDPGFDPGLSQVKPQVMLQGMPQKFSHKSSASDRAPIQVTEVRALIKKTEQSANARKIELMIEDFAVDAQITIYSLESEPLILNRLEYYQNLATVFTHYRAYSNRMAIDDLKMLDSHHANVRGTTYEKINFSDRPINGISNWQAKIEKRDGKLLYTKVDAYLSRAQID